MTNQLAPIRHSTFALWRSRLSQRRLRFIFRDQRFADGLALLDEPNLANLGEARAGRNEMAHDNVFLEAAQTIDLAKRRRFREDTRRILERRCRDKAVGFE